MLQFFYVCRGIRTWDFRAALISSQALLRLTTIGIKSLSTFFSYFSNFLSILSDIQSNSIEIKLAAPPNHIWFQKLTWNIRIAKWFPWVSYLVKRFVRTSHWPNKRSIIKCVILSVRRKKQKRKKSVTL